jgi:hypothetical protein
MGSKSVFFLCAVFVFGSLMLVAVTSHGLTNTFNVYAANNCDATSNCNNTELLSPNNQNNNCSIPFAIILQMAF